MEQGGSRYGSFSSSECSRIWTFLLWYIILIFLLKVKGEGIYFKILQRHLRLFTKYLFLKKIFSFFWSFHSMACDMLGALAWGLLGDSCSLPCTKHGWRLPVFFLFLFFISSWKKKIMTFVIILAMNCLLWSHSK